MTEWGKGKGQFPVLRSQLWAISVQFPDLRKKTPGWVCTVLVAVISLTLDRGAGWGSESCARKKACEIFGRRKKFCATMPLGRV